MIIFYSGSCGYLKGKRVGSEPGKVLGEKATIMLSYFLIINGMQDQKHRWKAIRNRTKKEKMKTCE